jgi:hypothetical protein
MDLQPYLDSIGTPPVEPAIRLAMLNLLSAAADEISASLAPGSVEVRLRGGDPQFVVDRPASAAPPPAPPVADEAANARISLRLSDRLKAGVDEAAGHEGISVNTWLVRVVAAALETPPRGLQIGQSYTGWSR